MPNYLVELDSFLIDRNKGRRGLSGIFVVFVFPYRVIHNNSQIIIDVVDIIWLIFVKFLTVFISRCKVTVTQLLA